VEPCGSLGRGPCRRVGTHGASQLLVTAGQNIERLHSEAAFAKIRAAATEPKRRQRAAKAL